MNPYVFFLRWYQNMNVLVEHIIIFFPNVDYDLIA